MFAYTSHDFADEGVALTRSFMSWGGRNLENRDYGGPLLGIVINGERVEEGVRGDGWNVIFIVVKCHIAECTGEVDSGDSPCASAQWRERDGRSRRGQGRVISGEGRRVTTVGFHVNRLWQGTV